METMQGETLRDRPELTLCGGSGGMARDSATVSGARDVRELQRLHLRCHHFL
jgi:hypothetical protein